MGSGKEGGTGSGQVSRTGSGADAWGRTGSAVAGTEAVGILTGSGAGTLVRDTGSAGPARARLVTGSEVIATDTEIAEVGSATAAEGIATVGTPAVVVAAERTSLDGAGV